MSFPKKGKFFPNENRINGQSRHQANACVVKEIASALKRSLGDSRAGVKTVVTWTGANEKTVKNWFSGRYGPSGAHMIALVRNSDEVLGTFLALAGRDNLMVAIKLGAAEDAIADLLDAVRRLGDDDQAE